MRKVEIARMGVELALSTVAPYVMDLLERRRRLIAIEQSGRELTADEWDELNVRSGDAFARLDAALAPPPSGEDDPAVSAVDDPGPGG